VPQDEASQAQSAQYLQAWDAIGELLDAGRSWSGRERNACFLNTADGRFASISGLADLDQPDDSRAVAVVDWDRDGDLDLWMSNRTAPRLRFLRNDLNQDNHFVSIKLEGRKSNRDAIGARVELVFAHGVGSNRFKTLRAGEGYLSQTTKWLHFPMPEGEEVATALVRWPGAGVERFEGLTDRGRFRLVEGTGKSEVLNGPNAPKLAAGSALVAKSTDSARIIPHSRLPLPGMDYVNLDGAEARLVPRQKGNRMLVTLWATWCAPCLAEMKELEANSERLKELGVELHPLNVESLESAVSSRLSQVKRYYGRNRLSSVGGARDR
jgi:thiol-disulfide isomerase/thioredoxin